MDNFEKLSHELSVPAIVKLFILDLTPIGQPLVYYYTPMVGENNQVIWGGETYIPFPISIESRAVSSYGAPDRTEMKISNVMDGRLFGSLAFLYGDLVGAHITYRETYRTLLNTSIGSAAVKYVVSKKTVHNKTGLAFELKSIFDKDRKKLPGRQILKRDFPGVGMNKRG